MNLMDKAERAFRTGSDELLMLRELPTASVQARLQKEVMDDMAECIRKYQFLRKVCEKYFWVSFVLFLVALFLSRFAVTTSGQELKPLAFCTWTAFGMTLVFRTVMTKKLEPRWELHEEIGDRLMQVYLDDAESQFSSFTSFHGHAVRHGIGLLIHSTILMRIHGSPVSNYRAFRDFVKEDSVTTRFS